MLIWIPRSPGDALSPPRCLNKDFQREWFNGLRDAMFGNLEMQGYLYKTDDLWRIAGAHCREYFDKYCSAVLACFNSATMSGREILFHSAQVELIKTQLSKFHKENTTSIHREDLRQYSLFSKGYTPVADRGGGLSPSFSASSSLDLSFNSINPKASSARARPAHGYTQEDFDERDLRKLSKAEAEAEDILQKQPWLSAEDALTLTAKRLGLSIRKLERLKKLQQPHKVPSAFAAAGD